MGAVGGDGCPVIRSARRCVTARSPRKVRSPSRDGYPAAISSGARVLHQSLDRQQRCRKIVRRGRADFLVACYTYLRPMFSKGAGRRERERRYAQLGCGSLYPGIAGGTRDAHPSRANVIADDFARIMCLFGPTCGQNEIE